MVGIDRDIPGFTVNGPFETDQPNFDQVRLEINWPNFVRKIFMAIDACDGDASLYWLFGREGETDSDLTKEEWAFYNWEKTRVSQYRSICRTAFQEQQAKENEEREAAISRRMKRSQTRMPNLNTARCSLAKEGKRDED